MKTILSALLFLFLVTGANAQKVSSKQTNSEKDEVTNFVVLIKDMEQMESIFMAAKKLREENKKKMGSFEVIVYGKGLSELADGKKAKEISKQAEEYEVAIIVCGSSLKKYDIDPKKLPTNIKIADNGIVYNLQLQESGYLSLEL